jgi:hypothetical protein
MKLQGQCDNSKKKPSAANLAPFTVWLKPCPPERQTFSYGLASLRSEELGARV